MNSFHGGMHVAAYTASKHGLLGLTRALANEWTGQGIRVNGIAPGWMDTELTRALREDGERYDALLARMPSGRWGTPADLAGAVVYLASEASDVCLGQLHRRRRRLPRPLAMRTETRFRRSGRPELPPADAHDPGAPSPGCERTGRRAHSAPPATPPLQR